MRPVKLVLDGLRSYRTKTEVDFTDLSLFALIGDTGAGKSSIIEALCLALYGGTTWSGRNVNELMSDATDRMAVELTFTAEGDTWTVTRAHRRSGAPTHKLTSASGEKVDGADAVNRRIQAILGLTKDQFLRAVVMPQGSFEKLLKATPGERTDILKGIFRLQALDGVRAQVAAIADRWKEPVAELQGERRTLPPDPDDDIATATAAHAEASARAETLNAHVAAAAAAERAATEAAASADTLTRLSGRATEELSGVSEADVAGVEAAAGDIDRRVADAMDKERAATAAREAAEASATTALGGFTTRDDAVTGSTRMRQIATSLADLHGARTMAAAALAALDAAVPPTAIPNDLQLAEETAKAAAAAAQAALRDAEATQSLALATYRRWVTLNDELTDARGVLAAAELAAADTADGEQAAELADEATRRELATAQAARNHAAQTNAAAAAAAGCQPGDDCPVCAQTLPATFTAPAAEDLDAAEQTVEAAALDLERSQRALRAAANAHAGAVAAQTAAGGRVDQVELEVAETAEELRPHVATSLRDDLTEEEAIAVSASTAAKALAAAHAADERLAVATAASGQARTELAAHQSRWKAEHAQHTDDLDTAVESITTARAELARLPETWRPDADATPEAVSALADAVQAALDEQAVHLRTAAHHQAEVAAAATELLELDTARATTVTQPVAAFVTAAARGHSALTQLNNALPTAGVVPEPPQKDTSLADIATAVTELRAAGAALAAVATTEAERLRVEAAARAGELDATLAAAGASTLGDLRAAAGGANSDASHAQDRLAEVTIAAARANQIDTALEIASPFLAALDALNRLLAGGKFIGHLVREREIALLTEASRVLRSLSGDRFGFGDGFKVIDRHSGQGRSPETLSGGERFQASLALALALVEIATRGGGQLEAVFVDEGFGSLDAGSLDQALTTLGAVASDGKLVALVSHLRQVAEYVDQVLLVERDDATGSHVRQLDPTERDALLAEDARSRMTA